MLLARMFGGEPGAGRLDAIYTSSSPPSPSVAALAGRLHVPLRAAPEREPRAVAHRALHEHGGGRVLLMARHDVFSGVVAALSGVADIPKLAAGDYSVVYVVTVPRIGHASLLRLNY
jgi:hypothetical protein